jgi:hypothetical protein
LTVDPPEQHPLLVAAAAALTATSEKEKVSRVAAHQGYANPNYKDNLWPKPLPDSVSGVNNGSVEPLPSSNLKPRLKQFSHATA